MLILLLLWAFFGFFTGLIAKLIHPGSEPAGCLPTIAIGVGGSFIGGVINFLLNHGAKPYHPSGIIMSIVGGVICCILWRYYLLKTSPTGPKSFFTGKKLR